MAIKKVEMTGPGGLIPPLFILSIYLLILLPVERLFLIHIPWIHKYSYDIFLAFTLLYLLVLKKRPPSKLGVSFQNGNQNLLIGGLTGGLILLSLPALDGFVKLSGLDHTELLNNPMTQTSADSDLWFSMILILVQALMEQIFFSGFLIQALLKKYNPVFIIYIAGVLFALLHFTFNLSTFLIGLFIAYGYFLTGTILAPVIFQVCCGITGVMLETFYPRLITLVGFLF